MKNKKRIIGRSIVVVVLIGIVVYLVATNLFPYGYNRIWIKGKTVEEVIEKYGEYDNILPGGTPEDNGYANITLGYIVKEAKRGYLGTKPPLLFYIDFDENGLAVKCYVRSGGIGG